MLKNDLQNGSDLLSKLLEEEWFEHVRAGSFIWFKVLKIPATEISMSSITGVELSVPSGMGSGSISPLSAMSRIFMMQSRARERGALVIKTDWNWALCMVDFSLVSVTKVSFCLSGGLPGWTCFELFKKETTFLCHKWTLHQ